jgi:hypothetical protein
MTCVLCTHIHTHPLAHNRTLSVPLSLSIDVALQEVSNWERNKTEIEEHEGNVMEWRVLLLDSTPSCILMHFAVCTCLGFRVYFSLD